MIDHDADSNTLEIKTDSELGSGDRVRVFFFDAGGQLSESSTVIVYFTSPMQYYVNHCTKRVDFPTAPPTAIEKIWRITLTTNPEPRVQIHCNGLEVVNILISDSTCKKGWKRKSWAKKKVKIKFAPDDNAADYYDFSPGNKLLKNASSHVIILYGLHSKLTALCY